MPIGNAPSVAAEGSSIYGIAPSGSLNPPSPTELQGTSNMSQARRTLAALQTNDLLNDSDRKELINAFLTYVNSNGAISITTTLGF